MLGRPTLACIIQGQVFKTQRSPCGQAWYQCSDRVPDHCLTAAALQLLHGRCAQVWDYAGDGYVHRLIQSKTDGKLVEVAPPRADARADASCSRRAELLSANTLRLRFAISRKFCHACP